MRPVGVAGYDAFIDRGIQSHVCHGRYATNHDTEPLIVRIGNLTFALLHSGRILMAIGGAR
jgi:hypothetical protein